MVNKTNIIHPEVVSSIFRNISRVLKIDQNVTVHETPGGTALTTRPLEDVLLMGIANPSMRRVIADSGIVQIWLPAVAPANVAESFSVRLNGPTPVP
jgi:hypothetical protein